MRDYSRIVIMRKNKATNVASTNFYRRDELSKMLSKRRRQSFLTTPQKINVKKEKKKSCILKYREKESKKMISVRFHFMGNCLMLINSDPALIGNNSFSMVAPLWEAYKREIEIGSLTHQHPYASSNIQQRVSPLK